MPSQIDVTLENGDLVIEYLTITHPLSKWDVIQITIDETKELRTYEVMCILTKVGKSNKTSVGVTRSQAHTNLALLKKTLALDLLHSHVGMIEGGYTPLTNEEKDEIVKELLEDLDKEKEN
jgi:hypothetical protein